MRKPIKSKLGTIVQVLCFPDQGKRNDAHFELIQKYKHTSIVMNARRLPLE